MTVATGTSPFRGEPIAQGDGSTCQWDHCVDAATAENIERSTVGRWRFTPTQVRKASGRGMCGGLSYTEAAEATVTLTGSAVVPDVEFGISNGDVRAHVDGGESLDGSIDCSATRWTARATNTFTGNHTISIHDYAWRTNGACYCEANNEKNHGEFLVEDPGTTAKGYQWWSSALLYKAMNMRTGSLGSSNPRCNVIVFRDTEGTKRTARLSTKLRAKPTAASAIVGSITKGRVYSVVKTANGQRWVRDSDGGWGYGWMQVRLANGVLGWTRGEAFR